MQGDWEIQVSVCTWLVKSRTLVWIDAVQETHFTCAADCPVLENDFVVLSAYGSHSSVRVFLLIGRILNADVNLVLADDGDMLVVANVAVKSFEFRVTVVYASNIAAERASFFREMRDALWMHFRDHFARCPDLSVQEFRSYLANFLRLREVEADSSECFVTEWSVRDALKQVGLNKSPTRWFTLRSATEAAAHVCAYFNEYVQSLVRPGSPPWWH